MNKLTGKKLRSIIALLAVIVLCAGPLSKIQRGYALEEEILEEEVLAEEEFAAEDSELSATEEKEPAESIVEAIPEDETFPEEEELLEEEIFEEEVIEEEEIVEEEPVSEEEEVIVEEEEVTPEEEEFVEEEIIEDEEPEDEELEDEELEDEELEEGEGVEAVFANQGRRLSAGGILGDQEDATNKVRAKLEAQKYTRDGVAHVLTWDAMKSTIEKASSGSTVNIKLGDPTRPNENFGGIAAYTTINIPAGVTVNIEAGTDSTIYTDATASNMGPFFNVPANATLNLNGVTLCGTAATSEIDESLVTVAKDYRMGKFWTEGSGRSANLYYAYANEDMEIVKHHITELFEDSSNVVIVQPGDDNGRGWNNEGYFNIKSEGNVSGQTNTSGNYIRSEIKNGTPEIYWDYSQSGGLKNYGCWQWKVVESGEGSYLQNKDGVILLLNKQGKVDVINGNTTSVEAWTKGALQEVTDSDINAVVNDTNKDLLKVTVSQDGTSYHSDKSGDGFFINVNGGTVNLNDGSELCHANGGIAPVYVRSGNVNVQAGATIHNNRAPMQPNAESKGYTTWNQWVNYGHKDGRDLGVNLDYVSAGAIVADGENANVNIFGGRIYGNSGQAGAIMLRNGAQGNQTGGIIGAERPTTETSVDTDNLYADPGHAEGNFGISGGAVCVSDDDSTFNMKSGEMNYNHAIVKGGAVQASRGGVFTMGDGSGENSLQAPVLSHNVAFGTGGAINVKSNNVFLYNGDLHHNVAQQMGGAIYVEGDSYDNTYQLTFPKNYKTGETNAFVYDNRAVRKGWWQHNGSNWIDGNGGGLWFCNWGSYFYDESYLEIYNNTADGAGNDFSKQSAKMELEGIGADFKMIDGHEWRHDRTADVMAAWGSTQQAIDLAGKSDAEMNAIIAEQRALDGEVLDNTTYYPRQMEASFDNMFTGDEKTRALQNPQSAIIIHDNVSALGGGIGSNGVISFSKLPMHYKKVSAQLDLEKIWKANGALEDPAPANDGREIDITITIKDKTTKEALYTYTPDDLLNGERDGEKFYSGNQKITWEDWRVTVNLPQFNFNIDKQLLDKVSEDKFYQWPDDEEPGIYGRIKAEVLAEHPGASGDWLNQEINRRILQITHLDVDEAQASITAPPTGSNALDYGAPENGGAFTVDGYTATVPFPNWILEIKEDVYMPDSDEPDTRTYEMDMADLTYEKVKNPNYPDKPYYNKTVDAGFNYYTYTDVYQLGTEMVNNTTTIALHKVDSDGTAMKDVGFTLYKKGEGGAWTKVGEEVFTDDEGNASFASITAGDYYIEETTTPDGYVGYGNKIFFSRTKDGEVENVVTGGLSLVPVTVNNRTEYQIAVGGQKIYATADVNDALLTTEETSYPVVLRYSGNPAGELVDGRTYRLLAIRSNGQGRNIKDNNASKGDYADMYAASGDVTGETGTQYNWTYKLVDGTGVLQSTNHNNSYIILESNVPMLTTDSEKVNYASYNGETFTFTVRNDEKVDLKLNKFGVNFRGKDEGDLSGASFTLYKASDYSVTPENRTNGIAPSAGAGTASFTWADLVPGIYYIVEDEAPDDYLTITGDIKISIDKNGNVTLLSETANVSVESNEVKVVDEKYPGLTVKKVSDTGTALEGAGFTLYYGEGHTGHSKGDAVGSENMGTDSDKARFVWTSVKPGKYYLKETTVPENYAGIGTDTEIPFSIAKDGTITPEWDPDVLRESMVAIVDENMEVITLEDNAKAIQVVNIGHLDVKVQKVWKDNQVGASSITVTLYSDIDEEGIFQPVYDSDEQTMSITISDSNGWKGSFTDLPKFAGDRIIQYTVLENHINGYDTRYGDPVFNEQTNAWEIEIENIKTTDNGFKLTVTKNWEGTEGATLPAYIEYILKSDYGHAGNMQQHGQSKRVTEADNWTGTWTGLPKFQNDGVTKVNYAVEEVKIPGYVTTISDLVPDYSEEQTTPTNVYLHGYSKTNGYSEKQYIAYTRYFVERDGESDESIYCMHFGKLAPGDDKNLYYKRVEITNAAQLASYYSSYAGDPNSSKPYYGTIGKSDGQWGKLFNTMKKIAYFGYENDGAKLADSYPALKDSNVFAYLTQYAVWEYTDFYGNGFTDKKTNSFGLNFRYIYGGYNYSNLYRVLEKNNNNVREAYGKLLEKIEDCDDSVVEDVKLYIYIPYYKYRNGTYGEYTSNAQVLLGSRNIPKNQKAEVTNRRVPVPTIRLTKYSAASFNNENNTLNLRLPGAQFTIQKVVKSQTGQNVFAPAANAPLTTMPVTDNTGAVNAEGFYHGWTDSREYPLEIGYYEIKESKTPDGYKPLQGSIIVESVYVEEPGNEHYVLRLVNAPEGMTWGIFGDENLEISIPATSTSAGAWEFDVLNESAVVLPSTGGMGTGAFVGLGCLLMAAAAAVALFRKRFMA